jgi:hypothetical protein
MSKETEPTSETTVPEAKEEKGIVRGTITYPWGTVRDATVNAGEISVASDSSGKYEFSSLEPGSYNIEAHAPFPGYEASAQKIEVAAGETKVLDIYLDLEKAVVEGHVYDANGKPVAGATLSGVLYGKDMQTATTDEEGYFRFDKVTPGDRFMRVNVRGYVGETKDFTAKKEGATVIEFRLQPASCRVYGAVRDESGKPVQAEILLMRMGIVIQKTNSDLATGSYEFPVVPGIYEVNAVASGYQPRGWHGSISADMKVDFSMVLAPEEPRDETG